MKRLGAEVVEVRETRQRKMFTILLDLVFRRAAQIEPLRADPKSYKHVLLLAPLWNRHIATPMRAAMRQLAPELGAYSFVTLCGGDRPHQSETVRLEATSAAGRPPLHQKEIWVEKQGAIGALTAYLIVRGTGPGRKAIDALSILPNVIPAILLAVGVILAWDSPFLPISLYGTAAILLVAYVAILLPYPIRYAVAALR